MTTHPRRAWIVVLALLGAGLRPASADPPRLLALEAIEVEGNHRTSLSTIQRSFPLRVGDAVDPEAILDAVDQLRDAELFRRLDFRTERGTERGRVRLLLTVEERGADFRFGTGYRDLDGWYLLPAQLRLDNRLGRGERARLSVKLGYRIAGVEAEFGERHVGRDGRWFWGLSAGAFEIQHRYFLDGVEYRHRLDRGHVGGTVGRRLGRSWAMEVGARAETIDAAARPEAAEDDELRGVKKGESLPEDQLPADIADDVGERRGHVLHTQLSFDRRARRVVAGTPAAGLWGRLRAEARLREGREVGVVSADLRAYRAALGGVLAMRVQASASGEDAAFYDGRQLGGLYTLRGFPSQSLSAPEGDTRAWAAGLEYRAPLVGRPDLPRVAGVLFMEAGQAFSGSSPAADDVAGAAGFGFRVRIPWIQWLGADFGIPIGRTPVSESFHAHGALGWNF